MSKYENNEYDVLGIADRLADKGFLSTKSSISSLFSKVDYKYKNKNEIMFFVKWNDKWDNKEMAKMIADAFDKHGYNARYDDDHVFVEIENYEKNLTEEIDDCFDDWE